ncbi:transmembrane protein C1orf162 homolog isoform X2 [Rhinatrema bivittatum]|uniref:transmembrane protein C1orf162 homolog isoform X2 n=1 Tax=Rhinatrema bivittatum TaxID=194408 RepID=UPI00112BE1C8|nr:transmembrane protein C1orf162 homolog isoform X2 [Rhinatrema bivittatum]
MGSSNSHSATTTTAAPAPTLLVTTTAFIVQREAAPTTQSLQACSPEYHHIILAFFSGVLLTLLITAAIFFIQRLRHKGLESSRPQLGFQPPQATDSKGSGSREEDISYATLSFRQDAPAGTCSNSTPQLDFPHPGAADVYSTVLIKS